MSTHRPLLRHVPKGALGCWGNALAKALHRFLSTRTWEALAGLLAFPKVTLALPHRGGRKHPHETTREVRDRVRRYEERHWMIMRQELRDIRAAERQHKKVKQSVCRDTMARLRDCTFLRSLHALMDDGASAKLRVI